MQVAKKVLNVVYTFLKVAGYGGRKEGSKGCT